MTVVTLDDLMAAGLTHAQRIVRRGMELTPLCAVAAGDQHIVIMIPTYGNPVNKEAICEFLRDKLKELDAHAYTIVMEAWFTEFNRGKDPRRDDPDYHPSADIKHRRECVTVMGIDRIGARRMIVWEIKRAKAGRVDFEDITSQFPGEGYFEGPLAELLPKVTVQ